VMKVLSETADFSLIQDPEFENIDWDWTRSRRVLRVRIYRWSWTNRFLGPDYQQEWNSKCIETHIDSAPWCFKTISQRPWPWKGFVQHADRHGLLRHLHGRVPSKSPSPMKTEYMREKYGKVCLVRVYHQSSWGITSTKNGIFVSSVNTTPTHVFKWWTPTNLGIYDEIVWVDHKMSLTLRSDTHINHFQRGKSHSWLLWNVSPPQYNWDWSKVFTKWQQGDSVKSTRAAIVIQSSWGVWWPRRG
jgi:hypothetical protein